MTDEHAYPRLPSRQPDPPDGVFELGLTLAGAVSGGAYAAGVMDFLFEALDEWYAARSRGESVPTHDVLIRALSGASAGSINGVLAATAIPYVFQRVSDDGSNGAQNPFYKPWVTDVSIQKLLTTGDLSKGKPLTSLLNADCLDSIASEAVGFGSAFPAAQRPYLANPLKLIFTVTNLRGVPYTVTFNGHGAGASHQMICHSDYMRFALRTSDGDVDDERIYPDDRPIIYPNSGASEAWKRFVGAVIASAAFPVGLRYRELVRPIGDYDQRSVTMADDTGQVERATLKCDFPSDIEDEQGNYTFVAVDGGCMDNEPFELVRIEMAGRDHHSPREGEKAVRGVVMIDPFPEPGELVPSTASELNMITCALRLITAWKDQARFKPEEVALALDESVYSRFMIAPARTLPGATAPSRGGRAIASGGLGGFLGFFCQDYRHHDYMLGRMNCQKFLKDHLVLPIANPIVARWASRPEMARWIVTDPQGGFAPIIPLVGTAAHSLATPEWPAGRFQATSVREQIKVRLDAIFASLSETLPYRWLARLAWRWSARGKILDYFIKLIDAAVRAQQLAGKD